MRERAPRAIDALLSCWEDYWLRRSSVHQSRQRYMHNPRVAFCGAPPVKERCQGEAHQVIQRALRRASAPWSRCTGGGIVTARDTSALLVVDIQNDFRAIGGYYDEKDKRRRAKQGKLNATDLAALARVYVH